MFLEVPWMSSLGKMTEHLLSNGLSVKDYTNLKTLLKVVCSTIFKFNFFSH